MLVIKPDLALERYSMLNIVLRLKVIGHEAEIPAGIFIQVISTTIALTGLIKDVKVIYSYNKFVPYTPSTLVASVSLVYACMSK